MRSNSRRLHHHRVALPYSDPCVPVYAVMAYNSSPMSNIRRLKLFQTYEVGRWDIVMRFSPRILLQVGGACPKDGVPQQGNLGVRQVCS